MKIVTFAVMTLHFISVYPMVIIGHRGACGYAPENTLSSFEKAIACDVDMVEFDVRKCASGELVVFHDAKIDRITNGCGYIAQKTLQELKTVKVCNDEQIVTLAEVIDFVDHRAKLYIELKSPAIAQDILKIMNHYVHNKQWAYDDFLIASFDHVQLREIKAANNQISIAALIYGTPVTFGAAAEDIHADVVCLDVEFITQQFVDDIHDRGMLVYVYTVNDQEDLIRLVNYNVDGIITDYPDMMYEFSVCS